METGDLAFKMATDFDRGLHVRTRVYTHTHAHALRIPRFIVETWGRANVGLGPSEKGEVHLWAMLPCLDPLGQTLAPTDVYGALCGHEELLVWRHLQDQGLAEVKGHFLEHRRPKKIIWNNSAANLQGTVSFGSNTTCGFAYASCPLCFPPSVPQTNGVITAVM